MKSTTFAFSDITKVATIPSALSARELAPILGVTRQAIESRIKRENWPFEEVPVRGGLKKLFPLKTLPLDIQKKVRIHFGEIPAELAECVPVDFDAARAARCATTWDAALEWQKDLARKRLEVLNAWTAFRADFDGTRHAADLKFIEMFTNREALGIDPAIYKAVHRLKRSALHEWQQRFAYQGIAGLISQHGHNRGQTRVPIEQQRHILGVFKSNPNLKAGKIAKVLRSTFNGDAVNTRAVRIFLRQQNALNPQIFTFLRSPDEWKSKHQLALGNASEKAHHFLHYVEVDSTIADVMCSDGKRYNVCGLIDIFSRKCKFLVTKTSSSWAIAGLIRNTIMDWGIPENLVRDNGKDYGSQMITDACRSLEIAEVVLPPFTPEEKPHIERVFGTLTRDLFETLPGYCGHNVAEAQAIRSRESFAQRYGKSKAKGTGEKLFAKSSSPDPSAKTFNIISASSADETPRVRGDEQNPLVSPFTKGGKTDPPFVKGGQGGISRQGLTPQALQTAIDRWVEQVYHLREHGSLRVSPNTKAASVPVRPRRIEDPRSLDILLAPAPKGETRVVLKDGLHLDGQLYWHDELIDWIGRRVRVKLDMRDAGRVFCFDPEFRAQQNPPVSPFTKGGESPLFPQERESRLDPRWDGRPCPSTGTEAGPTQSGVGISRETSFICEALDLSISGIPVGDMVAARKRAKKRMLEGVKAMKVLAADVGDPLAEEIRQIREGRATVANLRVGQPVDDNPFVDAANAAAAALDVQQNPPVSPFSKGGEGVGADPRVRPGQAQGPAPTQEGIFSTGTEAGPTQLVNESDPKVLRFVTRAEEQEVKLYFKNCRERFDWLREAQRHRTLGSDEIRWLLTYIDEWFDHADWWSEKWPERDRLWLGKIAPDHFPQYTIQEEHK